LHGGLASDKLDPFTMRTALYVLFGFVALVQISPSRAADLYSYVNSEAARIERQSADSINDFKTPEGRARRHAELLDMFGLSPMPARGDLHATITGRLEDDTVAVEKIHFQSSPGLYVTANLYLPKKIDAPLPAVLYVCGHAEVKTNGVSFGNKTAYQHHGAWFARNGYACLVIDTVQLGEIPGLHHGTYREGMWWWNSRGYSPAAVEAWNCIRALDYLETRPEIDKTRFAITGRSGGGAYSWFTTALDPRIKVAAPVAGITDLHNHVIDGTVEGHCDCMFFVNTYAWDYPMLAACAAPRPLLVVNTDKDSIFPLDGVMRTYTKLPNLYRALGNTNDLGLVIGPGPHKDTQDLQIPVFRWFNHYLRHTDEIIDLPATNHFTAAQLRVFEKIPADQRNTTVHEWFIPKAAPGPRIATREQWTQQRDQWMRDLRQKVFRNWPQDPATDPQLEKPALAPINNGVVLVKNTRPMLGLDAKAQTQLRRRYMLIGTTLDATRVHDIVWAIEQLNRTNPGQYHTYEAEGNNAANLLFASLFTDKIKTLRLKNLPATLDKHGPDYLNILRVLDIREALALAFEHTNLELTDTHADETYAEAIARTLNWSQYLERKD
jgi:dienelactone hydrolase